MRVNKSTGPSPGIVYEALRFSTRFMSLERDAAQRSASIEHAGGDVGMADELREEVVRALSADYVARRATPREPLYVYEAALYTLISMVDVLDS